MQFDMRRFVRGREASFGGHTETRTKKMQEKARTLHMTFWRQRYTEGEN